MRLSLERRAKLYWAIHEPLVDLRIKMGLLVKQDHMIAQVLHEIWRRQKKVLNLEDK